MNINDHFKTIDTFKDFDKFLTKPSVKVTFWSQRVIKVKNYTGTIKIEQLVNKFIALIKKDIDFDESLRPSIKKVSNLIDSFYKDSDSLIECGNIFTRIFNSLTYIFSKYYSPITRWYWNECDGFANSIMKEDEPDTGYHYICKLYTKNQYQNTFNRIPPESDCTRGPRIKGLGDIYIYEK